jgi:hypothetical protein
VLRQDGNSCVQLQLKLLFDAENVARTSNAALRARKSVAPGASFDVSRNIDPVIDPFFPKASCRLLGFNLICVSIYYTWKGCNGSRKASRRVDTEG